MITITLSGEQVAQLADLLTVVAAAADTSDEDRYQLDYCRGQVGQLMPGVEVLVLAGVLSDMTDRPGPDLATRQACRAWSADLAQLLNVASAATAAAISQHPSFTEHRPQALRLAS
jgi:hypothetical protein